MRANFEVWKFFLTIHDMGRIDGLASVGYRVVSKDRLPWAPDWD